MDRNRMFLLWLAAGAGVVLLYAAYKDKSPTGILTGYATGTPAPATPQTPPFHNKHGGSPNPQGGNFRHTVNSNGAIAPVPDGYPLGSTYVPGNG